MRKTEEKPLVKIAIMGPHQSGITSYIKAIKSKDYRYHEVYQPSFSIDFQLLEFENMNIQLLDLPEDKFNGSAMIESYLKLSAQLVLLLDVSQQFHDMQQWLALNKDKIMRSYGASQSILVLLNKVDKTDVIPMVQIETLLVTTFPLFQVTVMYCSVLNGFGVEASKEQLVSSVKATSKRSCNIKKSKPKNAMTRAECVAAFITRLKTHQQQLIQEQQECDTSWLLRFFTRDNKDVKLLCIRTLLERLELQSTLLDKFQSLIDLDSVITDTEKQIGVSRWHLANTGFFSSRFATNIKKTRQEWQQRSAVAVMPPVIEPPIAPF